MVTQRNRGAARDSTVITDDRAFRRGLVRAMSRLELSSRADLQRLAIMVQNNARQRCPVRTGRLRSSITHTPGEDARGPFVDVGSNVEYGPYVEYGTMNAPAQPFMRPALAEAANEWRRIARSRS